MIEVVSCFPQAFNRIDGITVAFECAEDKQKSTFL